MKNIISILSTIFLMSLVSNIYAGNDRQEEVNKQNVIEFYEKAINQKDFEGASRYSFLSQVFSR